MKIKIAEKAFLWALIFGFICSVFWSFADFDASCEELRHGVLRLHIIANSDSETDQALKLKIRDKILLESEHIFETDCDLNSAIKTAENNLKIYEKIANKTIEEAGLDYKATATVGNTFFNTRVYEDFTLPSGEYKSLIINIGEGKGKNWWCVIFPSVCIPGESDASLSDSVGKSGTKIAENSENYVIRFKAVEIYEKIKRNLKHN